MKYLFILMTMLSLSIGNVNATDTAKKEASPAQHAQQEKMKTCNAEAGQKNLKGEERKKFMSDCLKTDHNK